MIRRFDHAVIAVRDLDQALRIYRDTLGLDARPGGRHPGRGTRNGIVRFGLDYLELITVDDPDEARASGAGGAELVGFLEQREGGLVGYCLATDDIEQLADRFAREGLEALGPFAMQRARPDGRLLEWRLLVPGGVSWRRPWPFFIQWGQPDEVRLSWEEPGVHPLGATGVAGVSVLVRDLPRAVDLYARQLGLQPSARFGASGGGTQQAVFELGAFSIRLLAGGQDDALQDALAAWGEGLHELRLRVASVERAREHLARHGVEASALPGEEGALLIPPEAVLGARLVLVGTS